MFYHCLTNISSTIFPRVLVKLLSKDKTTDSWQVCLEQMVEAVLLSADLLFLHGESLYQPD